MPGSQKMFSREKGSLQKRDIWGPSLKIGGEKRLAPVGSNLSWILNPRERPGKCFPSMSREVLKIPPQVLPDQGVILQHNSRKGPWTLPKPMPSAPRESEVHNRAQSWTELVAVRLNVPALTFGSTHSACDTSQSPHRKHRAVSVTSASTPLSLLGALRWELQSLQPPLQESAGRPPSALR